MTLGSLLVLWLVIELLETECDRLGGGELRLSLFVGVGLVAFIRKVLIATLSHEDIQMELVYLGGIFIFGINSLAYFPGRDPEIRSFVLTELRPVSSKENEFQPTKPKQAIDRREL